MIQDKIGNVSIATAWQTKVGKKCFSSARDKSALVPTQSPSHWVPEFLLTDKANV
jgi:hypothetical protein